VGSVRGVWGWWWDGALGGWRGEGGVGLEGAEERGESFQGNSMSMSRKSLVGVVGGSSGIPRS